MGARRLCTKVARLVWLLECAVAMLAHTDDVDARPQQPVILRGADTHADLTQHQLQRVHGTIQTTDAGSTDFLKGVRDLAYDAARQLVITAGIHGTVAVINVSSNTPTLVSTLSPSTVVDAHGLAYDAARQRVYVASVSQATVTCIDATDPYHLAVVATVTNTTWLYYSTHLSFDAGKSALYVTSAGNGDETNATTRTAGHSISSIVVAPNGTMALAHRMTSWAPDISPGVNKTQAYPVYSVLDHTRHLMYVSNDARCTVEIINVTTLVPRKVGNYTSCTSIEYNSQAAFDPVTKRLFTAAQHANSFAVVDVADPAHPALAGLLQDSNRSSRTQLFAGATGCAFDGSRNLAYVASEFAARHHQSHIINQNGATSGFKWLVSNIWIRDVCLLSDPSTFAAGSPNQNMSRVQHKEV